MKSNVFLMILMFLCYGIGAQTIATQSFEATGDTWVPVSLSTPACSSGSDILDFSTSLNGILHSHLIQFWGVRDLNGN